MIGIQERHSINWDSLDFFGHELGGKIVAWHDTHSWDSSSPDHMECPLMTGRQFMNRSSAKRGFHLGGIDINIRGTGFINEISRLGDLRSPVLLKTYCTNLEFAFQ